MTAGPAGSSGPLVLVVEDDPSVRGLLETLLSAEGYQVETAADGVAGLVKANVARPAVMLLDLMMPDPRRGPRARGGARRPGTGDVPVLVLTGKLEAVPALRDLLGEESVFVKPFGVTELLDRVAAVTGGPGPGSDLSVHRSE